MRSKRRSQQLQTHLSKSGVSNKTKLARRHFRSVGVAEAMATRGRHYTVVLTNASPGAVIPLGAAGLKIFRNLGLGLGHAGWTPTVLWLDHQSLAFKLGHLQENDWIVEVPIAARARFCPNFDAHARVLLAGEWDQGIWNRDCIRGDFEASERGHRRY